LKRVYKKKFVITGASGLLGSYFYKKFKNRYKILKYPYRIENIKKFEKWISKKKFEYFVHFAALPKGNVSELNRINTKSTIDILKKLKKNNFIRYFLFISTSHVYAYSRKSILENGKVKPINNYGLSKKKVEDFIIKNTKNFDFKIGIARIFNITGPKQRKGYFIPDMYRLINMKKYIDNINCYRDFVHIEDVVESINILIKKKFNKIVNISSGKKINLIEVCKAINAEFHTKKIVYGSRGGKDLFGNNTLLKSLGKKKFKNIKQIIKSFRK
tara:strand:+ start:610 stop:1425 length:816 start_codon:yes stop_codon:yes gene_type:complete